MDVMRWTADGGWDERIWHAEGVWQDRSDLSGMITSVDIDAENGAWLRGPFATLSADDGQVGRGPMVRVWGGAIRDAGGEFGWVTDVWPMPDGSVWVTGLPGASRLGEDAIVRVAHTDRFDIRWEPPPAGTPRFIYAMTSTPDGEPVALGPDGTWILTSGVWSRVAEPGPPDTDIQSIGDRIYGLGDDATAYVLEDGTWVDLPPIR